MASDIVPRKVTVAEVTYDNVSSRALSVCHENDNFSRKSGSSRALSRALSQHPALSGFLNKERRKHIYQTIFRSEPSPYAKLRELVKGRPGLAYHLIEEAKRKLSSSPQ